MNKQKGFALQEALLAVALMSVVLGLFAPVIMRNSDDIAAKATADDFGMFQKAASAHFLSNRAAYVAAMTDGTNAASICKINVDPGTGAGGIVANNTTLHTCAIDGSMLSFLQALPDNVKKVNRYGESWVAIYKLQYTKIAPIAPTGGVEMLVVSANVNGAPTTVAPDARRYSEARTAAEFAGGGVIPEADRAVCKVSRTSSIYQACGNGWLVNLADFISPAELAQFGSRIQN